MKIAVIGASGFVGKNLIRYLFFNTNHEILAVAQDFFILDEIKDSTNRLKFKKIDIFDTDSLGDALKSCDIVYYFVHMMDGKTKNLYEKETKAAISFVEATKRTGVKKVVYLSGLGDDKKRLSEHLLSRHNTGNILRAGLSQVIEFRACVIVGTGSVSFEIVRELVSKISFMILPKWAYTLIQPIRLEDVLSYLCAILNKDFNAHQIIEIGGPEKMSYKELFDSYAKHINKKLKIIVLPFLPNCMSKILLFLFLPQKLYKTGKYMIDSLENEMVVTNKKAAELFPEITPTFIFCHDIQRDI